MSLEQRQKAFNDTVELMYLVIPESNIEKGQLYDTWEGYNKYLQHILRLRDIFEEERMSSIAFSAPRKFCEILNDYQRYVITYHFAISYPLFLRYDMRYVTTSHSIKHAD